MIEKKSFTGGLSTDRDGAYLQPNQYLNALNIRVTSNEEGSEGVLTNIKGNTEVTFTLPSGTNTCIGSFEDAENHRVFYFIHNSSNDHMILCYFHKENTIRKVMEQDDFTTVGSEDGLNFSASNLLTGIAMNDDLLFFTDNLSEPKRINVERGLKKHDASYTQLKSYDVLASYPSNMTDTMVTLIRQAPTLPLEHESVRDESVNGNNIEKEFFTFSYRFVYIDGEVSSLAPYSKPAYFPNPQTTEKDNNVILVTVPENQSISKDVLEIEFLVKFRDELDYSVFFIEKDRSLFQIHDDDSPIQTRFQNDGVRLSIPSSDVTRYSSAVPVKAKGLECAKGRVFLGNTTEGLDNLNESGLIADSTISFQTKLSNGDARADYFMFLIYVRKSNGNIVAEYIRLVKVAGIEEEGFYSINADASFSPPFIIGSSNTLIVDWLDSTTNLNATNYPATGLTLKEKVSGVDLNDGLEAASDLWEANTTLTNYEIINAQNVYIQSTSSTAVEVSTTLADGVTTLVDNDITLAENLRVWKDGSVYKFGLLFLDRYGRNGRVIELTGDEGISIPKRSAAYTYVVDGIDFSLPATNESDYIPEWAYAYSFVRTKSLNKSFFLQFQSKNVFYTDDFDVASTHTTHSEEYSYVAVELSFLTAAGMGYTYSEGDLITLYGVNNDDYTLKVLGQSGLYVIAQSTDMGNLGSAYSYFAELFTPRLNDENAAYHEFGETYLISGAGTSSRGFTKNTGDFEGDVVIKLKTISNNNYYYQAVSGDVDSARSWIQVTGRPFNTTRFQQVHKPHSISFSENRLTGSLLNGLSTFNALDEKTLPSELGSIQKILLTSKTESLGNTMLAIGTNETASVYIGEAQVQTAGGAAFLAVQAGVIGSVQVLRGSYGTLHPESVVEQNGRVYFLDALNGTCVQYDVNGLMPIGDRGIGSFFRERCDLIVTQNKTGCHGGFDANENEYILTIPEVSDVEQEYFNDYVNLYSISANILNGYQGSDYNATFDISVSIKKNRKYRVKVSNLTLDSAVLDEINLEKADGTLIGSFSATGANSSIQVGDFIEFTASEDASSLKVELSQISGSVGSDDVIKFQTFEFRPSYYKLDNGDATTIAYSEDVRAWTTFYSYAPENMVNVGTQFITFKGGGLWKHDTNNTRNNFYGTQYVSRVSSISKEVPSAVKTFSNISVEGNVPPSFTHFRTESKYMDRDSSGNIPANPTYSDYIQSSDLSDSEFRQLEGVYYAGILRDRLQPAPSSYNEDTYNTNMMSGQKLTNQFMLFTLEFDNTSKVSVRFANIGFNAQRGHKL